MLILMYSKNMSYNLPLFSSPQAKEDMMTSYNAVEVRNRRHKRIATAIGVLGVAAFINGSHTNGQYDTGEVIAGAATATVMLAKRRAFAHEEEAARERALDIALEPLSVIPENNNLATPGATDIPRLD